MSDTNRMEYLGYHTKPEYSANDRCFVGTVFGINDTAGSLISD
jgi:predicted HicB family RNase H-like nuclease